MARAAHVLQAASQIADAQAVQDGRRRAIEAQTGTRITGMKEGRRLSRCAVAEAGVIAGRERDGKQRTGQPGHRTVDLDLSGRGRAELDDCPRLEGGRSGQDDGAGDPVHHVALEDVVGRAGGEGHVIEDKTRALQTFHQRRVARAIEPFHDAVRGTRGTALTQSGQHGLALAPAWLRGVRATTRGR